MRASRSLRAEYSCMAVSLPILCYHKVGNAIREGRRLNVEPERLESHIRLFRRRGFILPTIWELASQPWPERGILFTFDDAYASTLEAAIPIFRRHEATCAIFAVPSLVGHVSSWDGDRSRPLADWKTLQNAACAGFEIGNHSMTHARLDSGANLELEVTGAKREIERHGIVHGSFCYPYGSWTPEARQAVSGAGYGIAFSLGKRPALESDDRLTLPRIAVAYSDAIPKLLYKIHIRPNLALWTKPRKD
jgi:peptidoglycan/xylan/chitin deacetylase (PgdA/CDA1 family)